jgi:hypothetical protein
MKRAAVQSFLVAVVMLAFAVMAEAQQPKKIPRIGFLGSGSSSTQKFLANNFRQGLRELGYMRDRISPSSTEYADGKEERFADLAAELVLRA